MLRVLILIIAIGAGGLAAWLALSTRSGGTRTVATVAAPVPMAEVLVAAADLAQGQVLAEANLRWQSWPKDAVNASFISRSARPDALATLKDSVVRSNFVSGEPIREEKLVRSTAGLLATILPSGKRAVAIRVSAESTAGGFILPNDRVDVIHTMTRQAQGAAESHGRTILKGIRVLAVDQKADEARGQAAVIGKTVTLELSEPQAELIVAAQASGVLSLALRSVSDGTEEGQDQPPTDGNFVRVFRADKSEAVKVQ